MHWYLEALRKYADFNGRSRRKEFWFFILFNFLAVFFLALIDVLVGTFSEGLGVGLLSGIYMLAILIPWVALFVRRIHDTGNTGWWALTLLIPFVSAIAVIIFGVMDSTPGDNEYGPNPKGMPADLLPRPEVGPTG